MKNNKTVDDYINSCPKEAQEKLQTIRQIIKEEAPGATEKLSYGMPYFSLNGRLVYFAAHSEHIGFYPMKTGVEAFTKELKNYETSPGTIRFPLNKPLPTSLIRKIIKFRVRQNSQKNISN